jgi:hypothetical protein
MHVRMGVMHEASMGLCLNGRIFGGGKFCVGAMEMKQSGYEAYYSVA